jgi:hypothetical protein
LHMCIETALLHNGPFNVVEKDCFEQPLPHAPQH